MPRYRCVQPSICHSRGTVNPMSPDYLDRTPIEHRSVHWSSPLRLGNSPLDTFVPSRVKVAVAGA